MPTNTLLTLGSTTCYYNEHLNLMFQFSPLFLLLFLWLSVISTSHVSIYRYLYTIFILQCIELYTNQDGDQNIGFYSLEMAADLELDPKQYHMIAFEDTGDCKNMCYIIQSHLEMLGNGNAFVVAQQPKVRIDP